MQYQVPQFIEVEDKIFGPLTFKQFAYLAGGGGISVMFFSTLPLLIAIVLSAPFIALGLALAFYTVNDKPFIEVMEHALSFYTSKKLYLWKQHQASSGTQTQAPVVPIIAPTVTPNLSESKLKDLAWSLNIKDRKGNE